MERKCPKCQSTKLVLVMGADRVRCQECGSYFDAEEVVPDRDLILKRIAYQIEEADKLIRNDPHRCMYAPEYAKGEILGLTSLREFIEASIPATPEPMARWMIYRNGNPIFLCEHGEPLPACLDSWALVASDKIESKLVEIREVKNG
jgi:hypothetical protein